MTPFLSLYLYASVSSSVWQVAKAAPSFALSTFSHGAELAGDAGQAADPAKIFGTLSDFKLDHDLSNRGPASKFFSSPPINKGVTSGKDGVQEDQAQKFRNLYAEWQNPDSHLARPLGPGTQNDWKLFSKQLQDLTGAKDGKITSLKNWLRENHVVEGPNFDRSVADLEWMMNRVNSQQKIWWQDAQIARWRASGYDIRSMMQLGDLLMFDTAEPLSATRIKTIQHDLIPILESAKWTKPRESSVLSGPQGAEASMEVQTLQALKPYDARIGQVVNKIDNKMASIKDGRSKLPADLNSDLYLLALLRGKATKAESSTQYSVESPNFWVTVRKPHGNTEPTANFIGRSEARRLEAYKSGSPYVDPAPGRAKLAWPDSPSPSPSKEPASVSPSKSVSGSPTESPDPSDFNFPDGTFFHEGHHIVTQETSQATRASSPWSVPATWMNNWVKTFTDKVLRKGGNLQNP